MTPAYLLQHWRFRINRIQLAHYEAARKFGKYNLILGIPAIVLSAVVGTTVFASLGEFAEDQNLQLIKILVGLLSVASAVFVGIQTFMDYATLAEKHRIAGANSANLKQRIELLGTLPPNNYSELQKELSKIENEWSKIRENSPSIPAVIWNRIEKEQTFSRHQERYPDFAVSTVEKK